MALTAEQQALDFNPELQDVSRQRKLADLLMAQGMQQPQGQMISGHYVCLLYTSPSPRDRTRSRMPSSA